MDSPTHIDHAEPPEQPEQPEQPGQRSAVWTPAQVVEDLLAQLDDAAAAGFAPSVLLSALQDEGIEPETASALVALGMDSAPAAVPSEALDDAPETSLELWPIRAWLQEHDSAAPLVGAFVAAGLARAHAEALLREASRAGEHVEAVRRARLRRVGLQGMAMGGACTLFFGWHALAAGPGGLWNLVPAGAALALVVYAAALYGRHREQLNQ